MSMENFLGEEVDLLDTQLHFEWVGTCMNILRGKKFINDSGVKGCQKYVGTVNLNGWNGYVMNVTYPFGEPILTNIHEELSFAELQSIMAAYRERMTPKICLQNAIARLAEAKHISVDAAIAYLSAKKVPCVSV